MATTHTPGPWKYGKSMESHPNCPWEVTFGDSECIAESVYEEADARLIAAAPALLAACEALTACDAHGRFGKPSFVEAVNQARAAIAKAKCQ